MPAPGARRSEQLAEHARVSRVRSHREDFCKNWPSSVQNELKLVIRPVDFEPSLRLTGSSSSRPPTSPGLAASAADGASSQSSDALSIAVRSPSSGSLTAFEAELVAVFADLVVLLGLPKSMGEIYGFIFASAEPPTFADIEQKLGLSKGSVSQGLRALRELGAVKEDGGRTTEDSGMKMEDGGRETEDGRQRTQDVRKTEAPRVTHWVATTELRQLIGTLLLERQTPY